MLSGADSTWPSAEELNKVNQVRKNCLNEISALSEPTRDVIGDVRLCRFLRFYGGSVDKATTGYKDFLAWRVKEGIDTFRRGVIDLDKNDFLKWVDSIRSPYAPPVCLELGESPEGHVIAFARPGFFKTANFVKERPDCHTMDTDLLVMTVCVEWLLKRLDDRSYRMNKVLYAIKIIDMNNLGREKLPIFIPELRNFAKTHGRNIMARYCEHDVLILVVNAPFVFRAVWAFASSLMSKRQSDRMKMFSDAFAKEPQAFLQAIMPPSVLPESLGGTRVDIPMVAPFAHDDPKRISQWMARTTPGLIRGQAPKFACEEPLTPCTHMTCDTEGAVKMVSEKAVQLVKDGDGISTDHNTKHQIAENTSASSVPSGLGQASVEQENSLAGGVGRQHAEDNALSNPAKENATVTPEIDSVVTPASPWSCCPCR